jgi:DNA ligase-1
MADTVDLTVVGYYKGRGQRAEFGIGTLLGAVYDPGSDTFKPVARMGSGLTEEEMVKMKELLDGVALKKKPKSLDSVFEPEPDVWCEPRYVVEVAADEVTRSPQHTCGREGDEPGYALRFPRIVGWVREDRRPEDATTVREIVELFRMQKRTKIAGRKS